MTLVDGQRGAVAFGLIDTDPGDDWSTKAACRNHPDPDLWFTAGEFAAGPVKPAVIAQIDAAKAVCAGCPVTTECLAYAQTHGEDWGIWGGLTRYERRRGKQTPNRVCEHCGKAYTGRGTRFCSPDCNKASRRTSCGTPAAAARHRAHGEPVDPLCRLAESMYRAQLKAIRKEGATA